MQESSKDLSSHAYSIFDDQLGMDQTRKENQFEDTTGGTSGVDIDNIVAHVAQKLGNNDK